ncbi:vegetative cell wall protein gp1-like [Cornus florida]|uniref:vegetative cell wall protein gp1-like n=1 Tax=Cornus florida TaxID=4283 RepID=UPI00289BA1D7|nr:vegetative cell wall protein gp1-like [Cornus florida]
MANQLPPARPWFRFSSTNRPSAPAPAPAPTILAPQAQPPACQPRPPFVRPTFRPPVARPPAPPVAAPPPATTYVSSSSPTIKVSPSSSSLPTSPAPKPSPKSTVPQVASSSSLSPSPKKQVLSASSSSLPTSPAPKVMSPPAPPSYISATAASTTTVNARAATPPSSPKSARFYSTSSSVPSSCPNKVCWTYSDSENFGVRVITIAGENRGAIMELSPSLRNKGNPTALNNNGEKLERESNEEGRSKMKDKTHKMVWPLKTTFMNSNVQGASNSILLDCSFTHHGPGVHHSLSGKANGGRGAQLND